MTLESAIHRIQEHAGTYNAEAESTIVGSLRPYTGVPDSQFVDLVVAIGEWHMNTRTNNLVDRRVPAALFFICNSLQRFVLRNDAPIRRDGKISNEDVQRIENWAESLGTMAERCLHGLSWPICLDRVCQYIVFHSRQNMRVYVPLVDVLHESINLSPIDVDDIEIAARAKRVRELISKAFDETEL